MKLLNPRAWAVSLRRVWRERDYLTPLKLANIGLVNLQWLLRTEVVVGRPYLLVIEPTNICNTNCQLCPIGQGHSKRLKGVIRWEEFRNLIDRHSRWIHRLNLSMWGEPLVAHGIYRMIQYAHRARVWTCFSTNLHAFRPECGDDEAMVSSGLDGLTCSLHAASQSTYEIYQPGKDFARLLAKIKRLIDTRRRMGSETPRIHLSFVVTRYNEHEMSAFVQLARDLGCEPKFIAPSLNLRFLGPMDRDRETENRLRTWLPRNPEYVKEPYRLMLSGAGVEKLTGGHRFNQCKRLWTAADITWDGTVVPCSAPCTHDEAFGDLSVETLGRIWNGSKYRAARRSMTRPVHDDVVCARCCGNAL